MSTDYCLLTTEENKCPHKTQTISSNNGNQSMENPILNINCVLLGDEKIGKSNLLNAYVSPKEIKFGPGLYQPTTREDYAVEKQLKDGFGHQHRIMLNIVDTGGQKDLDRLRPLCYNQANVFILCFSVVVPSSFQSLMTKWLPEIRRHTDQKKILLFLIGTQSDLRSNTTVLLKLSSNGLSPVPESRAIRLGEKIGANNYIECSALTHKNIRQIFEYVMISGVHQHYRKNSVKKNAIDGGQNQVGGASINSLPVHDKENKVYYGKKGRQLRQMFSKQWNVRKSYKMKRLMFFSCLFN